MKKVLLIRLSSLGDVIFNIPLANALKDGGYEVTWLTSEKGADVVEGNPCAAKTIIVPVQKWKKNTAVKNFFEYLSILKEIRKEKYYAAIDCQRMFKSFYWMAFCAAERRIICRDAREFSRFGANEVIPAIQTGYQRHSVNNYLQFAKHLGLKTDSIKFTLPETPPAVKTKVDGLLNALSSGKPVVVIAPATTWELKHWKPDNWKELVNALKDKYNLIFTGMECDKPLISYIGGDEFINLTGKTNIQDLIEIFSRADLVIAPDSGSCHLARAVCKPAVIAIFTCTPAGLFGPVGEGYFSVSGSLECQPCLTKKCPLKHKRCVNYPQPQEIINIVNNLFKKQVI